MKKRWIAASALLLLALLLAAGAAGAAYRYDSSRSDVIAQGVTVAGVDVGGMEAAEAQIAVRNAVVPRLDRPLRVGHKGRGFVLDPDAARVSVDIDAMVEEAVQKSRDGSLPSRVWRDLTGTPVRANVPLRVTYSEQAVNAFVRRVESEFERAPRNAEVDISATGVRYVPSRNGLSVRTRALRRELVRRLSRPGPVRLVGVPTKVVEPKVTSAELLRKYRYLITISRADKRLRLFRDLELAKVYRIAVGRIGFETPAGLHKIVNKAVNPAWSAPEWAGQFAGKVIPAGAPNNPIKARWLGFYDGAGIHGTDDVSSIGTAASHGCIRMTIPDVVELYDRVPVGTPLYIG